jgi:hypothetical protein
MSFGKYTQSTTRVVIDHLNDDIFIQGIQNFEDLSVAMSGHL